MAPKYWICRIQVGIRFQIEFNFRDAKQHLGLAACQARTAARHHFHVERSVLATLAWTRLELRHAAQRALDRFSSDQRQAPGTFLRNGPAKATLRSASGRYRTLQKCPEALRWRDN